MIKIQVIVLYKRQRRLVVNNRIVSIPVTWNVKDSDLYLYIRTLYSVIDEVQYSPIFYMEYGARKWEPNPKINYYKWSRYLKDDYILKIAQWRDEVGDILTFDRIYNDYNFWRESQEVSLMENLL